MTTTKPPVLTDEEIRAEIKAKLVSGQMGDYLEDDGYWLARAIEQAVLERAGADAVRDAVLDDAASACENRSVSLGDGRQITASNEAQKCAHAIRALKGTPAAAVADAQPMREDTHAFKNFHRLLCERFGYAHDEIDWRRDQLSLIEHIAAQVQLSGNAGEVERDARRWQYLSRKLCLTGNGDGTCSMHSLNLPGDVKGWPEPGEVDKFCGQAIDAAIAASKGANHG